MYFSTLKKKNSNLVYHFFVLLSARGPVESLVAQVCKALLNISAHKTVQVHNFITSNSL